MKKAGTIINALTGKQSPTTLKGKWIEIPEYNSGEITGYKLIEDKE